MGVRTTVQNAKQDPAGAKGLFQAFSGLAELGNSKEVTINSGPASFLQAFKELDIDHQQQKENKDAEDEKHDQTGDNRIW